MHHDSTCRSRARRRRLREEAQAKAADRLLHRTVFEGLASLVAAHAGDLADILHFSGRPGTFFDPARVEVAHQGLREAVADLLEHADQQVAAVCNETPGRPFGRLPDAAESDPAPADSDGAHIRGGNETQAGSAPSAPAPEPQAFRGGNETPAPVAPAATVLDRAAVPKPASRTDTEAALLRAAAADPRLRHGDPDRVDDLALTLAENWSLGTWSKTAAAGLQLLLHQDEVAGWTVLLPPGPWGREGGGGHAAVLHRHDRPKEGEFVMGDFGRPRVSEHAHEALEHIRWGLAPRRRDAHTARTAAPVPADTGRAATRSGGRLRDLVDQRLAQQGLSHADPQPVDGDKEEMLPAPKHPHFRGVPSITVTVRQLGPHAKWGHWWRLEGWPEHPDIWLVTGEGHEVGWVERNVPGLPKDKWAAVYEWCFVVDAATGRVLLYDTPEDAAYTVNQAYLRGL
ncbi:hypothetical protein [Kitasatospora fiedleri]|uniref:hypothetical protein n=1 Tax=Kitasatospora fiedleri TaxID=2991545 RepID=UPI00249C1159|nr:hypothetical protein [Kitasatospora fiedleri]